ncbi:hypothetical protein PR202_gb20429 [Eleusine coracana subsp. coracana]|uniref:DUF7769 domain-containing protein n=1 Tax=Eleusine coracana subsp. coracana TaxID=191504 RepID=A0AAV5FCD3_ELECO|nr:hypothetical protein PR202_gb20429 [Eleusine coracana subsp. coracana]
MDASTQGLIIPHLFFSFICDEVVLFKSCFFINVLGAGRRKDCSDEVRQLVFQTLLARSKNGRLGKKVTGEVATQFGLGIYTVQAIWRNAKVSLHQGIVVDVKSRKRGRCDRKEVPIDLEPLRNIPLNERMTLDDVSRRLHVGKAKLIRYMRKGLLRRHSNMFKPYLTEANKKTRLQFCVNMIDQDSTPNEPYFKDLFDHVFIDEKWFFLTQSHAKYYLLPDEDDPHRSSKSKNYIPRLMFLSVTARPGFVNGVCVFDGKIGCFPLVTWEQAKRSSVNRQAGTWEVKPIAHKTREVIREFMIERVLPAIKAKWPIEDIAKPIYIVQDNSPSHIEANDALFCEHAKKDGFDIRLVCQPPNSPDFNILDLGFFRAIQSIQYKMAAKTVQDLVPIVQEVTYL